MLSKFFSSRFYTTFCLVFALLVSLATSSPVSKLLSGDFVVSSDCVTPAIDGLAITVSNFQILEPSGTSYLDLGFPTATVGDGNPIEGTVNGKNRLCKQTYGDEDLSEASSLIFSCFDDSNFACSILFNEI